MVAKLCIIKVASGEQRSQTAVTLIASETLIVAPRTERYRFSYHRSLRQNISYQEMLADG